jgi:hypothetical protein
VPGAILTSRRSKASVAAGCCSANETDAHGAVCCAQSPASIPEEASTYRIKSIDAYNGASTDVGASVRGCASTPLYTAFRPWSFVTLNDDSTNIKQMITRNHFGDIDAMCDALSWAGELKCCLFLREQGYVRHFYYYDMSCIHVLVNDFINNILRGRFCEQLIHTRL